MIEFINTTFEYEANSKVLHDINLKIKQGETVGIIGANGAGKSTFLKLIVGILIPTAGEILVTNLQVKKQNLKLIRQKIGFTFQESDNQLFMPTVYEDIAFSANQENKPLDEVKSIVEKALEQVNGQHLANKASYKLSGGEKRIVTIATALASEPEILILDEPSVGLDPKSRRELINLLASRKETKIIATHDMDMALQLCDRVIVFNNGTICGDDKPLHIFRNRELLRSNHLELPLSMQGCLSCGHVTL